MCKPFITLSSILLLLFCTSPEKLVPPEAKPDLPMIAIGYPAHRADGNHWVQGRGKLPEAKPLDIALNGIPEWIVCAPYAEGSVWLAVLTDGQVQAFKILGKTVVPISILPDNVSPGTAPLLLVYQDGRIGLGNLQNSESSNLTHPVVLNIDPLRIASIQINGDIIIQSGKESIPMKVNALPDARILVDEAQRILLLTDPTERYTHGVLGDAIEAGSITLMKTMPNPVIKHKILIPPPFVIEGIAPIWTDITGDGIREIIVTISDALQGARLIVFDERGHQLAQSAAIGKGYRWRHQIAVAPFEQSQQPELVSVLTPHIGGIVEYFQFTTDTLLNVTQLSGCTSHVIGTRNLDMALAGDFDGDGQIELLLPNQALSELCAVQRAAKTAQIDWTLDIEGQMTSNLAAVTLNSGEIVVGLGNDQQLLKIWTEPKTF